MKKELDIKIYKTAEEICEYVLKTFEIRYTANGMVKTLGRLGYSYKKATSIPGKMDISKQESFVELYESNYKKISTDEKVYFVDGCHPTYNNHIGYGWIRTGATGNFVIKSPTGRERINLLGAYSQKEGESIVFDYKKLNQHTVVDFLNKLRSLNGDKKIHFICDNASYLHAKLVRAEAEKLNIHIVYLPSYSPNLNLIERYWGFMKKYVLRNCYYETFDYFKSAILEFCKNKSDEIKEKLLKYIPEKFHLIKPMLT